MCSVYYPVSFAAQTQQVSARLTYLAVALPQGVESFPHGMADCAEIAFEDDGVLLLRGYSELPEVED